MAKKIKQKIEKTKPLVQENLDKIKKIKIRVIGIGGGGGTIVSEIASQISKVSFVVANTDLQALKTINKKVECFHFGENLTRGFGTGARVDLGREAAQREREKIKKLCQGYDLCIIVACLGGGTGTGAAPVFAKISKSLGNITYGIFTLPFKFEGEKKIEMAKDSLKNIKNYLDAITVIPNEKIFQVVDRTIPIKQAFSVINKGLSQSLEGLINTVCEPGLINIDFADLKTIFYSKGKLTYLNQVEVLRKKEDKEGAEIKSLIDQVLASPFYPYTIKGARGVLFNISGEGTLSLAEVNQISKKISELVSPEAKIVFGINEKKRENGFVGISLLAVGCEPVKKPQPIQKLKKKKNINKISQKTNLNDSERPRKNGLQIKSEVQELEKEMLEQEKFWEAPAFLRRKLTKEDS